MKTESGAEYFALEQAENLRKKAAWRSEKKKPGRQWGASEPGQEGESPEWTLSI